MHPMFAETHSLRIAQPAISGCSRVGSGRTAATTPPVPPEENPSSASSTRRAASCAAGCTADGTPAAPGRAAACRARPQPGRQQFAQVARQFRDALRLARVDAVMPPVMAVFLDGDAAARRVHHDRRRPPLTRCRCWRVSGPARLAGRSDGISRRRSSRRRRHQGLDAASSTRAVALLMLGIIEGCTQPASISTLRGTGFSVSGRSPARAGPWPSASAAASRTQALPQLHRGPEHRAQPLLQAPAAPFAAEPRGTFSSTMRRPLSPSRGTRLRLGRWFLIAAGEAVVQVQLRSLSWACSSTSLIR